MGGAAAKLPPPLELCSSRGKWRSVRVVSTAEFRTLLGKQDVDSLLELVRATWGARGYDCTVADGVVEATDGRTGESVRIAVAVSRVLGPSASADRADVLVATRDTTATRRLAADRSASFVGPDQFREMLLYGVDVDTRRDLFRTYFGRDPVEPAADEGWRRQSSAGELVVVGVVVSLLVVATLGGGAWLVDEYPASTGTDPTTDAAQTTATPVPERNPPGVTEDSVADVTILAAAHGRVVRDASYRLRLTRQIESVGNGSERRVQRGFREIAVTDTLRFRTQSGGNISVAEGGFGSLSVGVYADGREVYRRVQRGNESVFLTGPAMRSGRFSNQVQRFVVVYLNTNQTRVTERDDGPGVVVEAVGSPALVSETVRNYTAVAVVRPDGFVRSLNVSYDRVRGTEVDRVRFGFVYTEVGDVEVQAPAWYSRARNTTAEES